MSSLIKGLYRFEGNNLGKYHDRGEIYFQVIGQGNDDKHVVVALWRKAKLPETSK